MNSKSMKDTYTNITTLSSQTQTASVVSQTNNYYSTLQSTGEEWFIDFRALIVLSAFTIGFLIQDLMILLTYSVRKISIKALSKSMLFLFILDLVYSGLAIYCVIKFIYFYNIDRSLSRSEEKYYRMLLEIETNKLQPMHCFMYFICVLIVRLFHYLIYFDEVGFSVLIEIMVKMTIKVFRFLVLFFIIILAFSFVGYGLFYDVEDYSTLIKSFNTMFKSSLGGFDYSLYDNSTISSSTAGRIYLSIYLLTSTIMLLNFLIALLNDTYTEYINNGSGLQSKEIIKVRVLYEQNDYYQCLALTHNLFNFYVFLLAPFVIIFKSKRLNRIIILIEYNFIFILSQLFTIIYSILASPLPILIGVFLKLRNAFSPKYSEGILDTIIRLIDCGILLLISPIIIFILITATICVNFHTAFYNNPIKLVGNMKDEYETINRLMDSSLIKKKAKDPIEDQRKYLLFKSIYTKNDESVEYYNPCDRMIAESIIYVMVATMKQMKIDIQRKIDKGKIDDSIPIYVPTVLVVNEFASNMLLSEHFKTIVFGIHNKSNKKIDESKLIFLAKTLANKTLNDFINEKDSFKEYDESNDGMHMLSELAGCNYETRYKIWFNKIKRLLLNSDELWLLNQFQYCKALLFNNSYEMDIDDIPEYLFKVIPYLDKFKHNKEIKNNMHTNDQQNEWGESDVSKICDSPSGKPPIKIKMLNIPSLIGFFIGNESKINKIYNDAAKLNNTRKLRAASELMIKRESHAIIKITSSNFSLTYKALNKASKS